MPLYQRVSSHQPVDPVLIVGLEGWIDAGLGGATAMATILQSSDPETLATFDGDSLIDYRARRPTVRIVDGLNSGLTWQEPRLLSGTDAVGRDVLLLVGPEPDMRWHAFVDDVVDLAARLGVTICVGLGAFPAPVPHTRPVRVATTATDSELAARVGFVAGTIDVPAGVGGALEVGFRDAGIPAIGLWARVPHYVAAMPYPAASAALLHTLTSVAGVSFDVTSLDSAADLAARRVDELIANSGEHRQMVSQLEASVDSAEGNPLNLPEIPTGDEIAAELQRFLREQG